MLAAFLATVATASPAAAVGPAATITATGPATATAGEIITYDVIVTNTGTTNLTAGSITDFLTPPNPPNNAAVCFPPGFNFSPGDSADFKCSVQTANPADVGRTLSEVFTFDAIELPAPISAAPVLTDVVARAPALTVSKTAIESTVGVGENINYQVKVENTGNATVTGIAIDDPNAPGCDGPTPAIAPNSRPPYPLINQFPPAGELAPGESTTQTCSYMTVLADAGTSRANIAEVTSPSTGSQFTNLVSTSVVPIAAGLTITKSSPRTAVGVGEPIPYTIKVENTGNVSLNNVKVTDPNVPACDRNPLPAAAPNPPGPVGDAGSLLPGESRSYNCAYVTLPGDLGTFSNTATVDATSANPTIVPPLTPQATSNVVDVQVQPKAPALTVVKTAKQATVPVGGTIDYTIVTTNTGNVTLNDVELNDPRAPNCDRMLVPVPGPTASPLPPDGVLAPGQSSTVLCSYTTVNPDVGIYTNTAFVDTSNPNLQTVASNTVSTTVTGQGQLLALSKTANKTKVLVGETITYELTVANAGTQDLTNVVVTDPAVPACNFGPIPLLQPGDSVTNTCTYTAQPGDKPAFDNTATADDGPGNAAPVDSNQVIIKVEDPAPALKLTKSAPATIAAGEDIEYEILVENTGNQSVTGIDINDLNAPGCDGPLPGVPSSLDPGDSKVVTCSITTTDPDDVGKTLENTATAVSNEVPLTISNKVETVVEARNPEVSITKTATQSSVEATEDIDFQIEVENTGNIPLTGIEVTDAKVPDCDSPISDLAPGESETVECTYTTVYPDDRGTFTNTATVEADQAGPESDSVDVEVTETSCDDSGLTDVPAWVDNAVTWLVCHNYATGYSGNLFLPQNDITRGEVARMQFRIAGSPGGSPANTFPDVPPWLEDAVDWIDANNFMTGYKDGTFRPNDPVSRGELARLTFRVIGSPGGFPPNTFTDSPAWLEDALDAHQAAGFMTGYPDGSFRPAWNITRAQTANVFYNIAGRPLD